MELKEHMFRLALDAYYNNYENDRGTVEYCIRKAIEAYLTEMFKPGEGMMLEPLEAIPQRDYRKELWIAAYLENGRTRDAHIALEGFDQAFSKENPHG